MGSKAPIFIGAFISVPTWLNTAEGINSVALYYRSVMNKKTVEMMFFDQHGKVNKVFAYYTK